MAKTRSKKMNDDDVDATKQDDTTDESPGEPSSSHEISLDDDDKAEDNKNEGDVMKVAAANENDDESDSDHGASKQMHYAIFCLLFMQGFMIHCRKYPFESYSSISMGHIVAYISVPRAKTSFYQDIVFLSFVSFCLFSMLRDSPYNANHHNM